jgi:hypothetical protein
VHYGIAGAAVKALSLTPPWGSVIIEHGKRIENRTAWKSCSYRGPILLHAAKGVGTRDDFDSLVEELVEDGLVPREAMFEKYARFAASGRRGAPQHPEGNGWYVPHPSLPRGGIIGRARIVDVIYPEPRDLSVHRADGFADWVARAASTVAAAARQDQRRWWFGGFALVLDDVEPLPFVKWNGALGLFEVPDDYATRAT